MRKIKKLITKLLSVLLVISFGIVLSGCNATNLDADAPNQPLEERDETVLKEVFEAIKVGCAEDIVTDTGVDIEVSPGNVFFGGGEWYPSGGAILNGYYYVFGFLHTAIPAYVIDIVGWGEFYDWIEQFAHRDGWRDPRKIHVGTFIEDFNISKEQFISAQEEAFGLSIDEIDDLVTWARTVNTRMVSDEDRLMATIWREQRSLSDIDTLFSNDVAKLWDAFPGLGVFHNNNAYSPEWLLNNMERSIYGELIQLDEIVRVLDTVTNDIGLISEIISTADAILQSATTAYNSPTPIPFALSFDLDPERDSIAPFADIIPSSIEPFTMHAWDGIIETLTSQHEGFPTNGPTKPGYDFIGWYLDSDFTIPITETFRMPARDVTLYARWQPQAEPLPTHTIEVGIFEIGWGGSLGDVSAFYTDNNGNQIPLNYFGLRDTLPVDTEITFTATPGFDYNHDVSWHVYAWFINGERYSGGAPYSITLTLDNDLDVKVAFGIPASLINDILLLPDFSDHGFEAVPIGANHQFEVVVSGQHSFFFSHEISWSVDDVPGVSISQDGLLTVADHVPVGTGLTVTALPDVDINDSGVGLFIFVLVVAEPMQWNSVVDLRSTTDTNDRATDQIQANNLHSSLASTTDDIEDLLPGERMILLVSSGESVFDILDINTDGLVIRQIGFIDSSEVEIWEVLIPSS